MLNIQKKFKRPSVHYRSAPFWAWNDVLDDKSLQYQLDRMREGGMAGGFIHSRMGLITPYFSNEWMARVRNTVRHAKRIGVPIYLYDEDRYPSGFAGGTITKDKKLCQKALKITRLSDKHHKSIWKFEKMTIPPHERFNNTGYLDTLKQDAVWKFIKSTYVAYKKTVGKEFNKTIPAIFTDEPNYLDTWALSRKNFYLPWTEGLEKVFKERYGYDLRENLMALVENKGDYKKVRYHFIKLLAELFLKNFGRQVYDWCKGNNISLTGHYLAEDTMASQIETLGSAMPFYEYMHIPGIDHLGRDLESVRLTIKQCTSVAHQLGKERVLSELFGGNGQNMTFADRKWIANWNTVLGINFFCPHLWLYSMAGRRKRDYPPTISYQQPYWKYNRVIEDYFARINFITSQGKFHSNILVIHPIESAWCLYNPVDTSPVDRMNSKFISLLKTLSGRYYDYDLGDESIISRYGRVSKRHGNPFFEVGDMEYRLIIIPPVISLRRITIELLNEFMDKGGKVIGVRPVPERVDGEKDDRGLIKQLYSRIRILPDSGKCLISSVEKLVQRDISITYAGRVLEIEDIYYQRRILDGKSDVYFLVNNNGKKSYAADIRIPAKNKNTMEIWDPMNGEIFRPDGIEKAGGCLNTRLTFPPAGSYVLITRDKSPAEKKFRDLTPAVSKPFKKTLRLSGAKWRCRRRGLNSLTLDHCQYKTGGMDKWSKPAYVLDVQDILAKRLRDNAPFAIKYSFKAGMTKRPGPVFLVMERPEQYEIKVNGKGLNYKDNGYWLDMAFRKTEITDYISPEGGNTIELKGKFVRLARPKTLIFVKGGTEIESVYLTGDFNVTGRFRRRKGGFIGRDFVVVDEKDPYAYDTVTSGYPFYAGEFVFSQEFEFLSEGRRIFLSFDKLDAVTLKVTLNKKEAGLVLWHPYRVEITDFVRSGKNLLEIEITNSLRNLLGPHHKKNPGYASPGSFNDKKDWVAGYAFVSVGIDKSVRIFH